MKPLMISITLIFLLAGCDNDQMTQQEYERAMHAKDRELADTTLPELPDPDAPYELKSPPAGDMSDHPLSQFFVPHGADALWYIGKFYVVCREGVEYSKTYCDKAVERGIRVGKSIGIKLTRKDLVNPQYWLKMREVKEWGHKYRRDRIKLARQNINNIYERNKETAKIFREFREKSDALMANMSDE